MKQLTLAVVGFERYAKTTRRAAFLAEMEQVAPWLAYKPRRVATTFINPLANRHLYHDPPGFDRSRPRAQKRCVRKTETAN